MVLVMILLAKGLKNKKSSARSDRTNDFFESKAYSNAAISDGENL
jgi:hypothetical protein